MKKIFIFFFFTSFFIRGISQTLVNDKATPVSFSIKLITSSYHSDSIIETYLTNNSSDTLEYLDVGNDNFANLITDNKNVIIGAVDIGSRIMPIKRILLPFSSVQKKIIVLYNTTFKGKFRVGYDFISVTKNDNFLSKSNLLYKNTNVIWSNELEIE